MISLYIEVPLIRITKPTTCMGKGREAGQDHHQNPIYSSMEEASCRPDGNMFPAPCHSHLTSTHLMCVIKHNSIAGRHLPCPLPIP
jgi:hypothetical protein